MRECRGGNASSPADPKKPFPLPTLPLVGHHAGAQVLKRRLQLSAQLGTIRHQMTLTLEPVKQIELTQKALDCAVRVVSFLFGHGSPPFILVVVGK
jgi:hypothetical protein